MGQWLGRTIQNGIFEILLSDDISIVFGGILFNVSIVTIQMGGDSSIQQLPLEGSLGALCFLGNA